MEKTVQIGDVNVPMKATAATALRYRQAFHRDLFSELNSKDVTDDTYVEICQRLAYVMAQSAQGNALNISEEGFLDWLEQYETLDLVNILPEVVGIYSASKASTSKAKKK